jgi:hypothetical protein
MLASTWVARACLALATVAGWLAVLAPPALASSAISLNASQTVAMSGWRLTLSGAVAGTDLPTAVVLYENPYPYSGEVEVAQTSTDPGGAFSFVVTLDRSTRYTVLAPATGARETVQVYATSRAAIKVRALTLGRARVTVFVYHPADLRWGGAQVRWWFKSGWHGRFVAAPSTRARRLSPYVVKLTTVVTLPAGRFFWRACFRPPLDHALVDRTPLPGCRGRGYHGGGKLPYGYPGPGAIARAAAYLRTRIGRTGFAVVDSEGRLSGVNLHSTWVSASVVKAMLLVAYLRRLHAIGQHYVDGYSNSFLYPMINVSDNGAATQTWSIVGNGGLYAVAHAAGMTDYSVYTDWASSQISPADQARFFFEMDSLIPREFVGYARRLLSTIAGYESWGIPAIARPRGYRVFFKGGWRGTSLGQLVHQVGRLEGHRRTFSIAVMTDGDASMGYGIDTIQGVTAALLR